MNRLAAVPKKRLLYTGIGDVEMESGCKAHGSPEDFNAPKPNLSRRHKAADGKSCYQPISPPMAEAFPHILDHAQ